MLRTSTIRRSPVLHTALVAWLATASTAASASTATALEWLGPHAGWLLLAALGLVAVILAAFTVRPPAKGMRSLMEVTTELREVPPSSPKTLSPEPASVERAAAMDVQPALMPTAPTVQTAPTAPTAPTGPIAPAPPAELTPAHEVVLALHHIDLSIDVLRRHISGDARPMPAVWLMLLDLARTHGREQTFRELAQEFHHRFNARTPAWDGYPPDREDPGLEAYPRLVKEITQTWGTHECRRLLDRLLYDNRGGNRKGFTLNAYNDLIALRRAADAVIDTIEQDLAEEAKVRSAFASADADAVAETRALAPDRSPLVQDLESQLDSDLRRTPAPSSALESEHPALAGMLAREWGNAALSARLCEMLARGGDGSHELSQEAAAELALLRGMAERLAQANGLKLPVESPAES